jgi:hypothetical protein
MRMGIALFGIVRWSDLCSPWISNLVIAQHVQQCRLSCVIQAEEQDVRLLVVQPKVASSTDSTIASTPMSFSARPTANSCGS